jgi:hypothetical protein
MDRDLEQIREAALDLDTDERARLVDELVISIAHDSENFGDWLTTAERRWESLEAPDPSIMEANYQEAQRRADAYDRGELDAVDLWEGIARVNKMIGR